MSHLPENRISGTRSGKLGRRLLLALGSTCLTLLSLEILFAVLGQFPPRTHTVAGLAERADGYLCDEKIGWRMRPFAQFEWTTPAYRMLARANAQGFRSETNFDPETPTKRIVLVGDSFTFGVGVPDEDTFGAGLQSRLGGVLVWNMGIPGFGLDQIWQTARHYALPAQPYLLIVGIYADDFNRSLEPHRWEEGFDKPTFRVKDGRLVPRDAADAPNALIAFLESHSRVWTLGRKALMWFRYRFPLDEWWSLNEAILDAMRADCRDAGVRVLFVYMPSKNWRPFPQLGAYMKRTEADYIDLPDTTELPEHLYIKGDGHLSEEGHRHVAAVITKWIEKNMPELSNSNTGAD